MITFILIAVVAILALAFVAVVWSSGKNKRSGQSETAHDPSPHVPSADAPRTGRASGPD